MESFQSRVAVVTGGGSGIGRALALAFAREGAERVLQGIRENALYILTHGKSRDILKRRAERLDRAAAKLA